MARKPEIDRGGKAAIIVTVRLAGDIIEMLDLLTDNRSKFLRDAAWEKINREMENREQQSGDTG
jgi:hypothetical protein